MYRDLRAMVSLRGFPQVLVTDNGPEFAGQALDLWASERGVKLHFIHPAIEKGICLLTIAALSSPL